MKVTGGGDCKEPGDYMARVLDTSSTRMLLKSPGMMTEAIKRNIVKLESVFSE